MGNKWKVEVKHDDSGKVVKTLEYSSENLRDKGYKGLIRNMNLSEYTAYKIDPNLSENLSIKEQRALSRLLTKSG